MESKDKIPSLVSCFLFLRYFRLVSAEDLCDNLNKQIVWQTLESKQIQTCVSSSASHTYALGLNPQYFTLNNISSMADK